LRRFVLSCALAGSLAAATSASAATIEVSVLQNNAAPSECTLREAIISANNDDASIGAFGCEDGDGADLITFDIDTAGDTLTLDQSLPEITETLTIRGRSVADTRIDGGQSQRVLTVAEGVAFTLETITISGGSAPGGNGGALQIQAGADVVVRDCRLTGSAAQNGGAIDVDQAALRVERCLLDANQATAAGGALRNIGGSVELVNSTLSGNTATDGSAIAAVDAPGPGTTRLHSVTLSANGGDETTFRSGGSEILARHTIFDGSCNGSITSLDFNLASDLSCGLAGPNDQEGAPSGLAALAGNGGPTATHALQVGSAAIDAGDSRCRDGDGVELATDQRGPGFPRRTDGDGLPGFFCDLGAYEAAPEPGAGAAAAAAAASVALLARRRRDRVPSAARPAP
jgi:hypothetical protein